MSKPDDYCSPIWRHCQLSTCCFTINTSSEFFFFQTPFFSYLLWFTCIYYRKWAVTSCGLRGIVKLLNSELFEWKSKQSKGTSSNSCLFVFQTMKFGEVEFLVFSFITYMCITYICMNISLMFKWQEFSFQYSWIGFYCVNFVAHT